MVRSINSIRSGAPEFPFLPPYSPDLNPIKRIQAFTWTNGVHALKFAKLKHLLRKAATRAKETLWRKIGDLLSQCTPKECQKYLVSAGYAAVKT